MMTLATILDNPGEPPAETRYRDPAVLRALGYTGLIDYSTTALGGLLGPDTVASGDVRRWVAEQYEALQQRLTRAAAAGLNAYLTIDAPSLARELVGSAMVCVNQPHVLCPASNELLDMSAQCIEALLGRVNPLDGFVLRLGDTDAHRLPYLAGNDIYTPHCARCAGLGRADRLDRFIRFYYDLIVRKLGRTLIVRAWNVRPGGMHDNPELCSRLIKRLPVDEKLIFSFKFTQTDFWRYQQWNPSSMVCGDRPIIYELQCQREFEGKGAVPNYQAALWRDGMKELDGAMGLAQVSRRVNLAGLWAWVRGGGWGGPYVSAAKEHWIDANVTAVPQLAANPSADPSALAQAWVRDHLGCADEAAADAIHTALMNSTQTALQMFYVGPYAAGRRDPWYPSGSFVQDDLIDAEAAWSMLQQVPDNQLDEVAAEKLRAAQRIESDIQLVRRAAAMANPLGTDLTHTLDYGLSLAQTLHHMLAALVGWRRYRVNRDAGLARAIAQHIDQCEIHWSHHQRQAGQRGTATAFRSDNLYDLLQRVRDHIAGA